MKYIAAFIIALIFLLPVCHASELNLVYDANGNLISGDGYFREYNGFNQLSKVYLGDNDSVLLQEYVFHPVEERVWIKKTYNSTGNITEKVIYWNKNFVTVVNDSGMYNYTYVYFNGQLVAQELDGVKTFIHSDHIGSATVVTNSSGDVIENTTYAPYGEIISGGEESRFNYEGKEYDSVVGDTDFNFRKYDQDLGIFTQPDTVIQNVYDPQSLNRYMFERGNPYKYTDPSGHVLDPLTIFFFGLAVITGIMIIVDVLFFEGNYPYEGINDDTYVPDIDIPTTLELENQDSDENSEEMDLFDLNIEGTYVPDDVKKNFQFPIYTPDQVQNIDFQYSIIEPVNNDGEKPKGSSHYTSQNLSRKRLTEIALNAAPGETAKDIILRWRSGN